MSGTQSPRVRFVQRNTGRIAFDLVGPADAPLIVCLPGMGDLRSTFRYLREPLLRAGFQVASMDLRGHGDSDATFESYDDAAAAGDAIALIEQLGGRAVVIGNSMGAGAATIAAATRPDLVDAVVLIGPFIRNVAQPPVLRWLLRAAMAGPWSTRMWLSYLPKLYPAGPSPDFLEHRAAIARSMRRPGYAAAFRRTTRTDHDLAWQATGRVQAPALVVMGDQDPDFPDPRAEAELAADALRGEVLMVPGAGHYPQAEFPDLVGPQVAAFLLRAVPQRAPK